MSGRDRSHNALVQAKQQADQAAASVQQLSEAAEKYGNTLDALNSKVKPLGENTTLPKPDLKPQPQKNPNAGLGGIDQLIEKAKEAKASLDAMFAGPQDEGLVDAISKAKTAVDAIKGVPTEMAQAAKNLGVGDNVAAITDKLIELNAKVNITKEAVQDFTKVWNDINKVKAELSGTNAELAYMAAGGTKAGLAMSEGFKQAQEELAKLSPTSLADYAKSLQGTKLPQSTQQNMVAWAGTAQQAQLQAIIQKLRDAGVEVKSTGNAFNDASAGLTQFYGSADKAKNALQAMLTASENLRKSLETLKVAQSDANMNKLGAFGGGNLYDIRQNDQRQAATQQVTQMQDAGVPNANFTSMSAQIAASGIAFTQGATAAETLTNALVAMDNATVLAQTQAATWKTILTQQQTAWTTFGTNSVDVLSKILQGTMSLKQGVKTVLADLMQTIANAALFDPLKANLTSAIQGLMSGGQGLNGFSFGNLFQGVLGLGQNSITGAAGAGIGGATKAIAGAGKDAVQLANTTAVTASTVAITANTAAMAALTSVVGVSLGTSTISDATSDVSALSAALTFAATGGYIQRFAGGGSPMVRGIGGPTGDKIPAWLSDGEFVVNAQGTKDNLSTLMAINNGGKATTNSKGWLRFASGGAVSTNGGSTVTPLYTPSVDQINRGTGSNSSVTSQTSHTTIDASTTLVVQGSIDSVTHDTLTATLNDRDQKMKAQLPALIDGRVSDSIRRNRY
jgi:hypothetical protein